MKQLILILSIALFSISCEKESQNHAKNISGTYQGREMLIQGQSIFLPDPTLGLSIDMFVTEIDKNNVSVIMETTFQGVRETYDPTSFIVKDDNSEYILTDENGDSFEISKEGIAIIEETFDGTFARVTFRKL